MGTKGFLFNSSGPWSMRRSDFDNLVATVKSADHDTVATTGSVKRRQAARMVTGDGVLTVPVEGVIMPARPRWASALGIDVAACDEIAATLREGILDPSITSANLIFSSPGGEVAGIEDVVSAIREFKASGKRVYGTIVELCTSAAFWVASQCDSLSANQNAIIGSCGVYTVMVDASAQAKAGGVDVIVVRSGEHKGSHVRGSKVEPGHIAAEQKLVNGLGDRFLADLKSVRSRASKAWMSGECWLAGEAKTLGLIDEVASSVNGGVAGSAKAKASGVVDVCKEVQKLKAGGMKGTKAWSDVITRFPEQYASQILRREPVPTQAETPAKATTPTGDLSFEERVEAIKAAYDRGDPETVEAVNRRLRQ